MPGLCILLHPELSLKQKTRTFTGLSHRSTPFTRILTKYPVYLWISVLQSLWYNATVLAEQPAVLWDEGGVRDTAELQLPIWFWGLQALLTHQLPDLSASGLVVLFVKWSKVAMWKDDQKTDGESRQRGSAVEL